MNETLKKLKLTTQNPVLILNVPEEYKETINEIEALDSDWSAFRIRNNDYIKSKK